MPNAANECKGVPVVGLKGDRFHRYESVGQATASYAQKILVIDPSGRGKDETGYAVLYQLNGYIFLMDAGGFRGGYEDTVLQALANIAKIHKVNEIVVEGNFGDGMYIKLLAPVVTATFPCAITEVKSKGQKELRICDVLEPVLGSHKLVIQESLIEKDYRTALNADGTTDTSYSLLYQLTRITRERGSLAHDDRLDALAIGVQFFTEALERDSKVGESEMLQEFLESHMEDALMGHDRLLEMSISEGVSIQYEDDGSMTNYMGW
ncbi:DNA packaging protein B [Pseudomonas phage Pf1 ERZ-2017]|nr:terminase large subunit [Pseudomonas phage Pf1 ERZ-2017]AUE23225.1 DNA packaging protein B [Pseudomonas phage Pf1 ERZ-2017]